MRQIFIDSRDRVSGTPSSFTIQLPETLVVTGDRPRRFRIDSFRLPMCFPTISAANRSLRVNVGGTWATASMAIGNYNGTTFASIMQTALQATGLPGAWTVTYDVLTLGLTISQTNDFQIDPTVGYGIALMLRPYTGLNDGSASELVWSFCPVYGIDVIYLASNTFGSIDTVGPQGSHDTLLMVNVTESFGAVIDRSMPWDIWLPLPNVNTQTLHFELRDRYYNLLDIVPNVSFSMTID